MPPKATREAFKAEVERIVIKRQLSDNGYVVKAFHETFRNHDLLKL